MQAPVRIETAESHFSLRVIIKQMRGMGLQESFSRPRIANCLAARVLPAQYPA